MATLPSMEKNIETVFGRPSGGYRERCGVSQEAFADKAEFTART